MTCSEDTFIEIFQFLSRDQLDKLCLSSRPLLHLVGAFSHRLPLRQIHRIECRCANSIWAFFTDKCQKSTGNRSINERKNIDLEAALKLCAADENGGFFKPIKLYSETTSPMTLWCQICGKPVELRAPLKPYPFQYSGDKFNEDLYARYRADKFPSLFKAHFRAKHRKLYEDIVNREQRGQHSDLLPSAFHIAVVKILPVMDKQVSSEELWHLKSEDYHSSYALYTFNPYLSSTRKAASNMLANILTGCYVHILRVDLNCWNAWKNTQQVMNSAAAHERALGLQNNSDNDNAVLGHANRRDHIVSVLDVAIDRCLSKKLLQKDMGQFYAQLVQLFNIRSLFTFVPMPIAANLQAAKGIFPGQCRHLDLQQLTDQKCSPAFVRDCEEAVKEMCFSGHIKENCTTFVSVPLRQMDRCNEDIRTWALFPIKERATSSLTIAPFPLRPEFIDNLVKTFLQLNCTSHLVQRRVALLISIQPHSEEFEDEDLYFNRPLMAKWKNRHGLVSTRAGEFEGRNARTGDRICLEFRRHESEDHLEQKRSKQFARHGVCPNLDAFVLELRKLGRTWRYY